MLHQTYRNWEYVLVNNCSNDGSSEIAEDYVARFPGKIRLIHTKSFLSQVQNYNFALTQVSLESKYCKMVQADDRIYPSCLKSMVAVAESDPSIGIVSSYRLRGDRIAGDGLPSTRTVIPGPEVCRLQLSGSLFTFGSPTTVLYRSEIVRSTSPFYDESTLHEDTDACYRILQTWNFGFVHEVLSFNRFDNESISSRVRDFSPELLDRLLQLRKFGPRCIERQALACLIEDRERDYYDFLARRLLGGADRDFWRYHVSGLKSGGQRLESMRLLKHVCLVLLRLLAHPVAASVRLYSRFRRPVRADRPVE